MTFELWIRGGTVLDYESLPKGTQFTHNIEGTPTTYRNLPQLFIDGGAGAPLIYDLNLSDVFDPEIKFLLDPARRSITVSVTGIELDVQVQTQLELRSYDKDLHPTHKMHSDLPSRWIDLPSEAFPRDESGFTVSTGLSEIGELVRFYRVQAKGEVDVNGRHTQTFKLEYDIYEAATRVAVLPGFRRLSGDHSGIYSAVELVIFKMTNQDGNTVERYIPIIFSGVNDLPEPKARRIDVDSTIVWLSEDMFDAPDPDLRIGTAIDNFQQWTHIRFRDSLLLDRLYMRNDNRPDSKVGLNQEIVRADIGKLYLRIWPDLWRVRLAPAPDPA